MSRIVRNIAKFLSADEAQKLSQVGPCRKPVILIFLFLRGISEATTGLLFVISVAPVWQLPLSKEFSSSGIPIIQDFAEVGAKSAWTEGRQHTQYFKHSLRGSSAISIEKYRQLIDRSLRCLLPSKLVNENLAEFSGEISTLQVPSSLEWDCYLIKYPSGSHIPFHTDPIPSPDGPNARVHRRLNALVLPAGSGGNFEFKLGSEVQSMSPAAGDAIVRENDAWAAFWFLTLSCAVVLSQSS